MVQIMEAENMRKMNPLISSIVLLRHLALVIGSSLAILVGWVNSLTVCPTSASM
jgi:hypothetical protein